MTELEQIDARISALQAEKAAMRGRRTARNWSDPEAVEARRLEISEEIRELNFQRDDLIKSAKTN